MNEEFERERLTESIEKCLRSTENGAQCNALDDQSYGITSIPYPFLSKPGQRARFTMVKNCPSSFGLFHTPIDGKPIFKDFSGNNEFVLDMELHLDWMNSVKPATKLFYIDKIIFETKEFDLQPWVYRTSDREVRTMFAISKNIALSKAKI